MNVKELIEKLKKLPQNLPLKVIKKNGIDDAPNEWVVDFEVHQTGQSGYEISGEVVLITSE